MTLPLAYKIIRNVDVPLAYVGLRILLVDPDTTSLSNIETILEEHSFKVTAIEQATIALSILREHINQFDLVMVDANMFEMDYLEFIKFTQFIKDKPIIYSLIEKDEAKRSKRMRSTKEEAQVKRSGPSEKEEDHSLLSKISTVELEKKLDEVVRELGDKAGPKNVLERMCVQDLTKECLTYRLKKYRSQKRQAPVVQSVTSNEEHHSNVLNSSNFSADVMNYFKEDIPQPPEVPSVANLPSLNDYSLNECDDWINEFLELDDFELKLS
ncbi:hypothetical protein MTR67_049179 [Solanum verrucosum]|uniref:Response regulatory domain-containing protein n=1 Tax=Solanum verrucosum TaxID=315347 RepID=A0AAF0V1Z0_SOLVR|nr:hypothetical protein MTR67_049179 [Solanum verrucosum]